MHIRDYIREIRIPGRFRDVPGTVRNIPGAIRAIRVPNAIRTMRVPHAIRTIRVPDAIRGLRLPVLPAIPALPQIDARAVGALAIALAGVMVGFTTGRMSAWVVPPSGMTTVAVSASAEEPQAAPVRKTTLSRPSIPLAADDLNLATGTRPEAEHTAAVVTRIPGPGGGQSGLAGAARTVTVINADAPTSRVSTAKDPDAPVQPASYSDEAVMSASSDDLERCSRRYRSFDPSDGTYQPYGRDGRVLCPYLR